MDRVAVGIHRNGGHERHLVLRAVPGGAAAELAAEKAIRPFIVGREGWLFSGTPRGAHASATLHFLIQTAKADGLEPHAYLSFLFQRLPEATTPAAVPALRPQALEPEDLKL
jgi:hypothetical protein